VFVRRQRDRRVSSMAANITPTAISACIRAEPGPANAWTIAKVEERLRPDKTSQGLYFSEKDMNFVCPWHGIGIRHEDRRVHLETGR